MTENKRFRIEYVQGNPTIFHIVENGEHIDEIKIVDLLNELADENEQLKYDATVLICSNQEYRKENEQLKSKNKELKKEIKAKNEIIEMYYELVKE